jgi:hypothetical protein
LPGSFLLILKGKAAQTLMLRLSHDELPASLVFARVSDFHADDATVLSSIHKTFGPRTMLFSCADRSVSRSSLPNRLGHAFLSISPNGEFKAQDLGSVSGSTWRPANKTKVLDFLDSQSSDKTSPLGADPLEESLKLNLFEAGELHAPNPSLLKFGNFKCIGLFLPNE